MKRRWFIGFAVGLLMFGGVLMLRPVQWRIKGWVRKEPFLQSLPASYWKQQLREGFLHWHTELDRQQKLTYIQSKMEHYGLRDAPLNFSTAQRIFEVSEAVPLLLELLRDPDPYLRGKAILFLRDNQQSPEIVLPAMLAQFRIEDHPRNRRVLLIALAERAHFVPDAVPELIRELANACQELADGYRDGDGLGELLWKLSPAEAMRLRIVRRE